MVFGKKQPKNQSMTINPPINLPAEIPELPAQDKIEVAQEVTLPKNFVLVTQAEVIGNNIYRYVIETDQRLYLGLQEE